MKVLARTTGVAPAALFASVLLLAGVAGAQLKLTLPMTGAYARSTGPFVDIPGVGGAAGVSCTGIKQGIGFGTMIPQTMNITPQTVTPASAGPGWYTRVANPGGCVPGAGAVTVTTLAPKANFTFPIGFFSQPFPGMNNRVTVPYQNLIISLSSTFQLTGPLVSPNPIEPFSPTMATGNNTAAWRQFRASAWSTTDGFGGGGQTGRVGKTFTWCYGNANCTKINQGTATNLQPLILKYKNGKTAGGFGGTMGIILSTHPVNKSRLGVVPTAFPPGWLGFNPIGMLGAVNSQANGRGYAVYDTDNLPAGTAFSMYMLTGGGLVSLTGSRGVPVSFGMSFPGLIPAQQNNNYGFPWTTGTVLVRNTGTQGGGGVPNVQTLTGMGTDMRSGVWGTGNIQLVAGSLTKNSLGPNTPGLAQMSLFIPEPGAMLQLGSGVLALLGIATWRSRKGRA